jgi:hypothetical protein
MLAILILIIWVSASNVDTLECRPQVKPEVGVCRKEGAVASCSEGAGITSASFLKVNKVAFSVQCKY